MSKSCETIREPGLSFSSVRDELHIQAGKQIERDDIGRAQVERKDVFLLDLDEVSDLVLLDVFQRFLDSLGVHVEPLGLAADLLGRGDHDAAVAATKVVEHVRLLHVGHFQHLGHDIIRRGHENDIGSLGLLGDRLRAGLTAKHQGQPKRGQGNAIGNKSSHGENLGAWKSLANAAAGRAASAKPQRQAGPIGITCLNSAGNGRWRATGCATRIAGHRHSGGSNRGGPARRSVWGGVEPDG
jgi:hypothetical protein